LVCTVVLGRRKKEVEKKGFSPNRGKGLVREGKTIG